MKKRFFGTFVAAFLTIIIGFTFTGCDFIGGLFGGGDDDGGDSLAAPTNVKTQYNIASWAPVNGADKYILTIDSIKVETDGLSYALANFVLDGKIEAGKTYTLYIQAATAEKTSEYSEGISFLASDIMPNGEALTNIEGFNPITLGLGSGIDVLNATGYDQANIKRTNPIFSNASLAGQGIFVTDIHESTGSSIYSAELTEVVSQRNSSLQTSASASARAGGFTTNVRANYGVTEEKISSGKTNTYFHLFTADYAAQEYSLYDTANYDAYRAILTSGFLSNLAAVKTVMDSATANDPTPEGDETNLEKAFREFFAIYGTHVVTRAIYGGRLEAYYSYMSQFELDYNSLSEDIGASFSAAYSGLIYGGSVSANAKYHMDKAASVTSTNTSAELKVITYGGAPLTATTFDALKDGIPTWAASLESDSGSKKTLTGIGNDGLREIWRYFPAAYTELSTPMAAYFEKIAKERFDALYSMFGNAPPARYYTAFNTEVSKNNFYSIHDEENYDYKSKTSSSVMGLAAKATPLGQLTVKNVSKDKDAYYIKPGSLPEFEYSLYYVEGSTRKTTVEKYYGRNSYCNYKLNNDGTKMPNGLYNSGNPALLKNESIGVGAVMVSVKYKTGNDTIPNITRDFFKGTKKAEGKKIPYTNVDKSREIKSIEIRVYYELHADRYAVAELIGYMPVVSDYYYNMAEIFTFNFS